MENSAKTFSAKRKISQIPENFHGNCIFDTSDFTTAVQKSLWSPWPLFAGGAFFAKWSQNDPVVGQEYFLARKVPFLHFFGPGAPTPIKPMD